MTISPASGASCIWNTSFAMSLFQRWVGIPSPLSRSTRTLRAKGGPSWSGKAQAASLDAPVWPDWFILKAFCLCRVNW